MNCPHCQTPLVDSATGQPLDPPPAFCDACGMSTGLRKKKPAPAEVTQIRCQECGVVARTWRCRGCGTRVRWPEGVEPPGEEL